jgi:hypothetical protein
VSEMRASLRARPHFFVHPVGALCRDARPELPDAEDAGGAEDAENCTSENSPSPHEPDFLWDCRSGCFHSVRAQSKERFVRAR